MTPRALTVIVYGTPAPQGSKRHVGHGRMIEQSKRVKPWRNDVKAAAETAIVEWEQRRPLPSGVGRCWERGHPNWRTVMHRVGKKAAGRLLDGVLHDEYPGGAA